MKKVLVTGGMGYIGSHTVVQLYEAGYEPIIVDNLCNSKPEVLNRIERICGKKPLFFEFDVRDEAKLDKVFFEHKIFAVIHFAGLKSVGESVQKPKLYFDNNIGSTEALLKAMEKHGCKNIVFSSSATVYGNPERVPIFEEDKVGPTTNPYGETKLRIEFLLKDLAKKAGYITHDETLCYTGYEDRSEGFSVELQKEDKSLVPYCILVMNDEALAKELCGIMQNEYTTCVRYGQAITFPESNSSAEFVKILTSIVQGKPEKAPAYIFE